MTAPTTCPRCNGDGFIEVAPLSHALNAIVEVPCPDCCCPCCGSRTGGGLCAVAEERDFLDDDDRHRRLADV